MSQIRCLQEAGMLREDGKRKCKVRGLKPGSGSGSSKDMIDIDNMYSFDFSKKLMISSWFIEPKFWNIYNIYIPHRFAGISQQHPFFGSYGSWGRGAWGFVAISWRWLGTRVSWPKVAWSGLARCCWVWQTAGSWCNVPQLCRWISPVDFTSKEQHGSQKRCFAIPGQVFIWI